MFEMSPWEWAYALLLSVLAAVGLVGLLALFMRATAKTAWAPWLALLLAAVVLALFGWAAVNRVRGAS